MDSEQPAVSRERSDLVEALDKHRSFLRYTVRDLTDEQARRCTTVSALCLGGVMKHVATVERNWAKFIVEGPSAMRFDPARVDAHAATFQMLDSDTLEDLLAEYEEVAARTDQLVSSVESLDASHPLPEAPWFPPGAEWSVRQVLLHILAETAQHAGHADIIREALDGAKTMG